MKEKDEFAERLERLGEALELSRGYRSQMGRGAAAFFGVGASLVLVCWVVWIAATLPSVSHGLMPIYPQSIPRGH